MTPNDPAAPDRDLQARLRTVLAERDQLEMLLRERERDRKEFFATLAHEMRNPLAAMRSAIHVLRVADTDHATASAARGMIERQLTQLVRLIDDLADVAHVAQERLELRRERVALESLLQRATQSNRAMLESRQQHLQWELPATPVWLYVDSRRMVQVFASILNNSSKFSDPGSQIKIHAARDEHHLVVTITDNGAGISEDVLPQVFDMFTRNGHHNRDGQIGLGVGMTLAKRLVELHGGRITVHSDGPGQGSSFEVKLNLLNVPPLRGVPAGTESTHVGPTRSNARVLIVDDNRDGAQGLALMLGMEGHEVRTAADGLEALAIAEQFQPHVVLLDIGMPGIDGYETARRLRARPWAQSALLCAQTGWGQEDDKRRARTAGFDRHLVKPVDPEELSRILAEVCQSGPAMP
ncbi:MAG TPA: ATP-binding protein [Steroidobacteraceae bacterium]|jgi:CheY-like chemotaxis protein/two-component sensor histidine kinase